MARNRAATRDDVSEVAVTEETTKAQRVPPSKPTEPSAAPEIGAEKKFGTEGTVRPAAETGPLPAGRATGRQDVVVHVEVICGSITKVKVPVAVIAHYEGLRIAGPAKAFDRQLDSWLTRALELGMIGSSLGQVFPVNLQKRREEGKISVDYLLLMGMGEPGRFATDDLRYLMSNVTVAVKSIGHNQLSTTLIGTRWNELPIEHTVHGWLEGILDGYERFRVIADVETDRKERFQEAARQPLFIVLVERDEEKATRIYEAFAAVGRKQLFPGLQLEVARGQNVPPESVPESNAVDTEPDVPVTLLRVTRNAAAQPVTTPASPTPVETAGTEVFQFSALSEVAAVTVRELEFNSYVTRELPDRMISASSPVEREACGSFFANYLIPEDVRRLTEGAGNLTLVVDETTAAYPWATAAHKKYAKTSFFGTNLCLSRQFRTLLSPPPSSPPPLNGLVKVLLIADPAPGNLSLPHAREEGVAIAKITDAQIGPFRNGLGFILDGSPVGHAVAQQFGQRYAALSTALLGAVSPTTPPRCGLPTATS
jgi:hypothetical protein